MKSSFTVAAVLLLAGCALTPRTDPVSLQKYDAIYDCAGAENPVRAQCGERFKDMELSGPLAEIKLAGASPFLYLLMRGDQYYVGCGLEGPQNTDQLAALNPGDVVTVRGTPVERRFVHFKGGGSSAAITFRPCTMVAVKQHTASRL